MPALLNAASGVADFNTASLIGGLVFALYAYWRQEPKHGFLSRRTGFNFASGTAIYPLALIAAASVSDAVLKNIFHTDDQRHVLAVAGILAIFTIVDGEQ